MDSDEIEVEEEIEVMEEEEGEEDPEEDKLVEDDKEDPEEEEEEEEEDPQEGEEEEVLEEDEEDPEGEEKEVLEEKEEDTESEEDEVLEEEEEDEENDPDEPEEKVLEEEEEDSEEPEEEYEEEGKQVDEHVGESNNSPKNSSNSQKDAGSDFVSERLDRRLGSCSSMTIESESRPNSDADAQGLKSTTHSDEQLRALNLVKEPTLYEDKRTEKSPLNENKTEKLSGNSQLNYLHLENNDETRRDNTAGDKITDSVWSSNGMVDDNSEDDKRSTKSRSMSIDNLDEEKISDSLPGSSSMCQKPSVVLSLENSLSNIKSENEKGGTIARPRSFCQFYAKGWCIRGKSCRFLHVRENSINTMKQHPGNNISGSGEILSNEDNEGRGKGCQLSDNNKASSGSRDRIAQRGVFSKEETVFTPSLKDMGSVENSKPSISGRGFGGEHISQVSSYRKPDMEPSQPVWTGSISHTVFNKNGYASCSQRQLIENGNKLSGSKSLSLQGFSDSSRRAPNDWEPSEPFRPSYVIPPSMIPSCGTLYDPFLDGIMDTKKPEDDDDLSASVSSKEEQIQKTSVSHREDKNSSCSQNQYQEAVLEMVANSVVEQNETMPRKRNTSNPTVNRGVLKRSRPHDLKSDMSSHVKMSKADVDGEVRSDAAGMKVTRHFRTALIEKIKELLKPIWHEGRLSKDVHNMIVKKAAEKIISTVVQFHCAPTDPESVEQYLSASQAKIVKLVEGYVEKFRRS